MTKTGIIMAELMKIVTNWPRARKFCDETAVLSADVRPLLSQVKQAARQASISVLGRREAAENGGTYRDQTHEFGR
jgi:hypothetical protein